jgi:hypothetical protein
MRRKLVWRRGIPALLVFLTLLVPGMSQVPTPYELVQVNDTAFMVLGLAQPSVAGGFLNLIGDLPGVRREQVNETAYLFVLPSAGNSSVAPCCGSLAANSCGQYDGLCSSGCTSDCPGCPAQCTTGYSSVFKDCSKKIHACCQSGHGGYCSAPPGQCCSCSCT